MHSLGVNFVEREGSLSGPIGSEGSFLDSVRREHKAARISSPENHGFIYDKKLPVPSELEYMIVDADHLC